MRKIFFLFLVSTVNLPAQPFSFPLDLINSVNDEQCPVFSPVSKTLYFTVANHPLNTGGILDKGDIWMTKWANGQWSIPVNVGRPLNNTGYNAVGGISLDGTRIYLFGQYKFSGQSKEQVAAVSQKNNDTWSRPTYIKIPSFPTRSSRLSGYVTPDESALVFAAESYRRSRSEDLYVSLKDAAGNWQRPINMGNAINTAYQEFSPRLSRDTYVLYFASNKRGGYGSFDIYKVTRLDNTWNRWSSPVNMGQAINSEGRELFYVPYAETGVGLYTSTLNSDGYGDIRMFRLPPSEAKTMQDTTTTTTTHAVVKGIINEKGSGNAVKATISFYADSAFYARSGADGSFSLEVPFPNTYSIQIEAEGYLDRVMEITLDSVANRAPNLLMAEMAPIEIGTKVKMENVLFERGTDKLLARSYEALDQVARFMEKNPGVQIELGGHTDNRGIPMQNIKLSQRRVDRVKAYLVDRGVKKSRVTGKGYGGSRPIASNVEEGTRKLNRRVEFIITKK